MTFLEIFDMYLMLFAIFNQYFDRFGQYLVMYLVTGLKGLPGWRFGLSRGLDPPGISTHLGWVWVVGAGFKNLA